MQLFESLNSHLMTKPRLPHALNKSPSVAKVIDLGKGVAVTVEATTIRSLSR